ncbi:hypothetical protein [Microscilla marina]|uniref:Uncharacterized protein n=1 Tax=Microscilla marina ATCC 23134 TaxID=313606 RepID=A1ZJA1_MICM2|nr:hypothetical protein [Microscilla marina]EAY29637.1 hypothetical protein M23134_00521 [Microscilla marina ATCC 23134]
MHKKIQTEGNQAQDQTQAQQPVQKKPKATNKKTVQNHRSKYAPHKVKHLPISRSGRQRQEVEESTTPNSTKNENTYLEEQSEESTIKSDTAYIDSLKARIDQLIRRNNERIERDQRTIANLEARGRDETRAARRARARITRNETQNVGLSKVLDEIKVLENSTQTYNITTGNDAGNEGNSGAATFNFQTGAVDIKLGSNLSGNEALAIFAHELKHAYQFEIGELSFVQGDRGGAASLHDLVDELAGYERSRLLELPTRASTNTLDEVKNSRYSNGAPGPYTNLPMESQSTQTSFALRKFSTADYVLTDDDKAFLQAYVNTIKEAIRIKGVTYQPNN